MRGLVLLGCSLSPVHSIAAQEIDTAGTKASLLMADRGLMRLVRARGNAALLEALGGDAAVERGVTCFDTGPRRFGGRGDHHQAVRSGCGFSPQVPEPHRWSPAADARNPHITSS